MACTKEIAKLQNRGLRFIMRGERVGDDKASLRKRYATWCYYVVDCKSTGVFVGRRWVSGELRLSKGCSCIGQPVGEMRSSPLYPCARMREALNLQGKLNSICHGRQMQGGRAVVVDSVVVDNYLI